MDAGKEPKLGWGWALGGAVAVLASLFAAAFLYMVLYSLLIHPGASESFYEGHAKEACPIVCVAAGPLMFFVVCFWIGRRRGVRPIATAFLTWILFILIDGLILIAMGGSGAGPAWIVGVSYVSKLLAALAGGRVALISAKRGSLGQA